MHIDTTPASVNVLKYKPQCTRKSKLLLFQVGTIEHFFILYLILKLNNKTILKKKCSGGIFIKSEKQ